MISLKYFLTQKIKEISLIAPISKQLYGIIPGRLNEGEDGNGLVLLQERNICERAPSVCISDVL